ncbi:hypothetical protein Tco_1300708 [Tanacetum coccineum]
MNEQLALSFAIHVVDPVSSVGDIEAFKTDESAPTPRSPQIRVPFAQTRLRRLEDLVDLMPHYVTIHGKDNIAENAPHLPDHYWAPLGYRAAGIWMRAASPPLLLPSTSHRTDIPEAEMPPRKRACFATPVPDSSSRRGSTVVLRDSRACSGGRTWDDIVEAIAGGCTDTLEGG